MFFPVFLFLRTEICISNLNWHAAFVDVSRFEFLFRFVIMFNYTYTCIHVYVARI